MTIDTFLRDLESRGISLAVKGEQLVVRGDKLALADEALRNELRDRKQELVAHLKKDGFIGRSAANFVAPSNAVPEGATQVVPGMLTLVSLTQPQIDAIAARVAGGHANIKDIYPLAPLQEGILFHHMLQPVDAYLMPMLLAFDSRERLERFAQALNEVIARHDILRTSVAWDGLDEPVQVVWRNAPFAFEVLEFPEGDVQAQLLATASPRILRLDVRQAPMMRGYAAFDREGGRWLLQFLFHHLVMDQITLKLLIGEIALIQQGLQAHLPATLPFRNFVAQARLGVSKAEHQAFFREMLGDVEEPTAPFGLLDIQGDGSLMREVEQPLEPELSRRLRRQARQRGVSTASLFHLAFAQVLAACTGRDDVVFGTVLFGRMQGGAGADRAIGMFINTLPLRVRLGESVLQCAQATHQGLIGLLGHEHASLPLAQQCSAMPATAPLFAAVLNYRYSGKGEGLGEGAGAANAFEGMQALGGDEARTNYPFALAVDDHGEDFTITVRVVESIGAPRICQFVDQALQAVVDALEQAPNTPMRTLQVLPEAERTLVVQRFNDTARAYPQDALVQALFEQQAQARPDAIALESGDQQVTYAELNVRANRLARVLKARGVGHGDYVATHLERSIELVVAQLAILKCAAAYVPLDTQMPEHRKEFILQDSGSRVVIAAHAEAQPGGLEWLDIGALDLAQGDGGNLALDAAASSHDAVYVMYTSGSTGQPKGVVVPHRGISRLVLNNGYADFNAQDRVAFAANPAFDASTMEVWAPLLNGGCCVVVDAATFIDASQLGQVIEDRRLSVLFITTALFNQYAVAIPGSLGKLRYLLCGGERNDPAAFSSVLARGGPQHLIHCYGPTETTTFAVTAEIVDVPAGSTSLPIGKPIGNTRVYILDGSGQPAPLGVPGEMYIGGVGVARGYLNRPDLTAARFLADPFSSEPGARMYRTGDLARWRDDGLIEFVGRNDHQVKIRGFRIELGEVEAQLARLPGIRDVVVMAREDDTGDKRLVAYVVAQEEGQAEAREAWQAIETRLDPAALRAGLAEVLPEYMVPSVFVQMESFPLTPNGKLDRKALPAPDAMESQAQYVAPVTATEQALSEIWAQVLKVERVGMDDDFFELGGHSLLAGQLVSRVRSQLGVEVALAELFMHSTLSQFAQVVEQSAASVLPAIGVREATDAAPLSFAQTRLWLLCQMEGASLAYHIPAGLRMTGVLDEAALRRALDRIVQRHEVLRTRFELVDGEPVQRIAGEDAGFTLAHEDLSVHDDAQAQLPRIGRQAFDQPFDLQAGPMIRATLVKLGPQEHALLFTMHHIISDGWSINILVNELGALYAAYASGQDDPLPPLQLQYADYAIWQRRWLTGDVLRAQSEYWDRALAGAPALLELPTDRPRPVRQSYEGAQAPVTLDVALTGQLKALAQRHGATLFMVVLAGWAVVLARLARQDDVVIGTPVANRRRAEIEDMIGFFVNTQAVRVDLSSQPTVARLLAQVKERALDAQQHQDLPFEQLVELIKPERSLSYHPIFQITFAWRNIAQDELQMPGLALAALNDDAVSAKFDLNLDLGEVDGAITGSLGYATALFDRSSIERHLGYLKNVLQGMVADEARPVHQIEMIEAAERTQLLASLTAKKTVTEPGQSLHALFEAQAARTPDAIALTGDGESLSYGELNKRANRIAHRLRALGVGPDALVGLCAQRSLGLVTGLLGILKAGGAYVPLDPAYPTERLAHMLGDARPVALVTQAGARASLPSHELPVVLIEEAQQEGADHDPEPLGTADNLAYVIYTSGSTGKPKGSLNTHRNVLRLFKATEPWFGFGPGDVWTLFHSYAFDFSVWELWGALLYGGRLVVVPYTVSRTPQEFHALLRHEGVTVLNQTPSAFQQLMAVDLSQEHPQPLALRTVIFGGEALDRDALSPWFTRHGYESPRLVNMYGITETTVHVTYAPLVDESVPAASIGVMIPDLGACVLDAHGALVPAGVAGELHVSGDGLARGYWGRAGLTAQKFVPNPYGEPGSRMYATGDLVRWNAAAQLEYLGRIDQQVKIRGFRIELGEIEAALRELPEVRQAVVVAREDQPGDKRLMAYLVARDEGQPPGAHEVREALARTLPEYMVPSRVMWLAQLPLTPNGKLDTKALPEPDRSADASRYVAPRTPTEERLAVIWSQVLRLDRVGVHDNFFAVGGDSIRAVSVLARAKDEGIAFSLVDIFANQTIARLAQALALDQTGAPLEDAALLLDPQDQARLPDGVVQAYPMTVLQKGMVFHNSLSSQEESLYHDVFSYQLTVPCWSEAALETVLGAMARKHPVLRTSFDFMSYSEPLQLVHENARVPLQVFDLSMHDEASQERLVAEFVHAERKTAFDFEQAPLLRIFIHLRSPQVFQYTLSFHHAILDGWSVASLNTELFQEYLNLLASGEDSLSLAPLASTPRVAVESERNALTSPAHVTFWQRYLDGYSFCELPLRESNVEEEAADPDLTLVIDEDGRGRLKAAADALGVPMRSVLLGAHLKVLSMLSGKTDVTTGLVSNVRDENADGEKVLGLFLNTLPLRQALQKDQTWAALIEQTFRTELDVIRHRHYPYFQLQLDNGRAPLFEVAFNYVSFHIYEELGKATGTQAQGGESFEATNFALAANFSDSPAQLEVTLQIDRSRLSPAQCGRVRDYYRDVLRLIAADPNALAGTGDFLSPQERHRLLVEWNDTKVAYPAGECMHELFEQQVQRTPDAVAVVHEDEALSYAQLNERANRLARRLQALGVVPDDTVALCVERGVEMVVGLLGILKAGGAYVPLDPAYPEERLAYMLADSAPRVLLVQEGTRRALGQVPASIAVLGLDDDAEALDAKASEDVKASGLAPFRLAYVIYTSGSTGQPKGVAIEHRNAVNFIHWALDEFPAEDLRRTLFSTSINFDLAVFECFVPLACGGTLEIVPNALGLIGHAKPVSLINTVPSAIAALLREASVPASVQMVNLAGEALKQDLVEQLFAQTQVRAVRNLYGPSETTTYSTWVAMDRQGGFVGHIGRPVANTQIYILDGHGQLVPAGVTGEIHIGGAGVARGYLNQPALTAQKFIDDPFCGRAGGRMYKTGDLGRWLVGGDIEYLGRNDHQVKIRGFRIEPGEIEARLVRHEGVREAAVLPWDDGQGHKSLVAYCTRPLSQGQAQGQVEEVSAQALRDHVAAALPRHMVPEQVIWLAEMPLTPNGKLDRKALPAPEAVDSQVPWVAPRTPTEQALSQLWAELLKARRVGLNDNFFALGGHSLLAVQLMSRIRTQLQVDLPLNALFNAPQFGQFAAEVEAATSFEALAPIPLADREQWLPLSFTQQRMWFLQHLEPGVTTYNIPIALRLSGDLDEAALWAAFDAIIQRHEILRTTLVGVEGRPLQVIGTASAYRMPPVDISALAPQAQDARIRELATSEAATVFDMARGPLLRVKLVYVGPGEVILLITMHHIVSDAWSIELLKKEFVALYQAFSAGKPSPLAPLALQYADYAAWQRRHVDDARFGAQLEYWKQQLAGAPTLLMLPTDRPRPALQSYHGASVDFVLPAAVTASLAGLAQQHRATLFMLLGAAYSVLLSRYTGQSDICIGTPVAGRQRADLEPLIGPFINLLVMRYDVHGGMPFDELLRQSRATALAAFANQEFPFESLVDELKLDRHLSHAPLFQALMQLDRGGVESDELPQLALEQVQLDRQIAKFDLSLFMVEIEGQLHCTLEYKVDLFDASTMTRMARHFQALLQGVAAAPGVAVGDLPMISGEERQRTLVAWNDTAAPTPEMGLHTRFEQHALAHPSRIAVVMGDTALTYDEVNRRANRVAHWLRRQGVGPEVTVAICMERSEDLIVAMLAVLKSGGAYLPLDPNAPPKRMAYMVADAGARIVITQLGLADRLADLPATLLCLDEAREDVAGQPDANPAGTSSGSNLAYVIYTSGSTGNPKGVQITHRGIVNYLHWGAIHYPMADGEYGSFTHLPLVFDASLTTLMIPLWAGRDVHIPLPGGNERIIEPMRQEQVLSIVKVTPAHVDLLAVALQPEEVRTRIRNSVIGGDILTPAQVRTWLRYFPDTTIVNEYGPTETVVGCCVEYLNADTPLGDSVLIGCPISNMQHYILDGRGQPTPVGVIGHLYIAGAGVARGYASRPALTAEKFVPDPFGPPGTRMYATGDLARYRENGHIEFLGRSDNQVKLRGYRIELGEIEAALVELPGIQQATVLVHDYGHGQKQLIAYVVPGEGNTAGPQDWQAALQLVLPKYMIPTHLVALETLPLTPSGKIDRKALHVPEAETLRIDYVAPTTDTETALASLWSDVLQIERVGINDNFFDIGGNSLLTVQLVSHVKRQFNVSLLLTLVFENQTIARMAPYIDEIRFANAQAPAVEDENSKAMRI